MTDSIDLVGSMTNNPQNCQSADPNWDLGHEGRKYFFKIKYNKSMSPTFSRHVIYN